MGAVIDECHDPVLVMECMANGSLEDLILHNASLSLDADAMLNILKDGAFSEHRML